MTEPEERPGPAPGSGSEGDGVEEFVRDVLTPVVGRVEPDDGRERGTCRGTGRPPPRRAGG